MGKVASLDPQCPCTYLGLVVDISHPSTVQGQRHEDPCLGFAAQPGWPIW